MAKLSCALAVCLITVAAAFAPAHGQDSPDQTASQQTDIESPIESAPIMIDGTEYFVLRGSPSLTAEARVKSVTAKIIEAAKSKKDGTPSIQIKDAELGKAIFVDGVYILQVTEADAKFEGFDLENITAYFAQQIDVAVTNYRAGRTQKRVTKGLGFALLWTVALFAFVTGLLAARRRSRNRLEVRMQGWLRKIEDQSGRAIDATALVKAQSLAMRGLLAFIMAIAGYYYIALVLNEFAYTKGFAVLLLDTIAAPLVHLVRGALDETPDLLTLIVIILIVRYFLNLLRLVFINVENGVIRWEGFDPQWTWPTHRIIRVAICLGAAVVCYPYIPGSDSAAFRGMTVLLGVVVSLGGNSVAANLFAGLIVVYKLSVSIGDRIKVGEIAGVVEHVSLLDTHVRSLKNELVSVPNTKMLSMEVVNYTQTAGPHGLIVHTTVGIGYNEDPVVVKELLLSAARETDGVKTKPGPFLLTQGLNSHDISYEINVYCKKAADPVSVGSELRWNILQKFNSAGVQIMTPFYTGDPDEPKIPAAPHGQAQPA